MIAQLLNASSKELSQPKTCSATRPMTATNCATNSISVEPSQVIPNRSNRKRPFSFSKRLYKLRWRIESAFNRLKDFRRIATRYDKLARNYLASVCSVLSPPLYGGFNESGP
jgi:Transposase DDE domain